MSSTLTVRLDDDVKRDTESILKDIGLNWTTAINVYAKAIQREHKIPFELKSSSEVTLDRSYPEYHKKIHRIINKAKKSDSLTSRFPVDFKEDEVYDKFNYLLKSN